MLQKIEHCSINITTIYFADTKQVMSSKVGDTETFYDREGAVLGVLKYKTTRYTISPQTGTRMLHRTGSLTQNHTSLITGFIG